jgi:hypothetical protein
MTAKVIAFPRRYDIPSAAIEDHIEQLIAILDGRAAAHEDVEPDPDLEDGGDAEIEAWPEYRWGAIDRKSREVRRPAVSVMQAT